LINESFLVACLTHDIRSFLSSDVDCWNLARLRPAAS
jgi:hypothetical protein